MENIINKTKENKVKDVASKESTLNENTLPKTEKVLRPLPRYTKGEEIFNMASHAAGGLLGVVILIWCTIVSAFNQNINGIVGSVIFGLTAIMLYTMSAVYHGNTHPIAKRVLQVLDHCTIYLLIAGTYTPLLLSGIYPTHPTLALIWIIAEWGVALIATVLTAIDMKKFTVFSMVCYLVLGWGIVAIAPIIIASISLAGFLFVLAGGIMYTVGSILYGIGKRKKNMHGIFHIFCLLGTIFHFVAILLYVI